MSTAELKLNLINQIAGITDKVRLKEIMQLLKFQADESLYITNKEEKEAEVAKNELVLDERQKDLEQKKGELDEIISETKQEEEKLREKAKVLETTIEPRLLQAFKRIRKNSRNGLGIVYVQRDACGGCFNKIPPQKQLDIRMRKKIIVCEYCGRIMIDPELAGVIAEQHLETVKR